MIRRMEARISSIDGSPGARGWLMAHPSQPGKNRADKNSINTRLAWNSELKNEAALTTEFRERRHGRVEIGSMGDSLGPFDEDRGPADTFLQHHRHEAAAIGELIEQRLRDLLHRTLDQDQVIGGVVRPALGQWAADLGYIADGELGKLILGPGTERRIAF